MESRLLEGCRPDAEPVLLLVPLQSFHTPESNALSMNHGLKELALKYSIL